MPIDFKNIKTTRGRGYNEKMIQRLNDSLQYISIPQRAAILGTIIEESGGNPLAKSKNDTYQGLLQWGADRYRISSDNPDEELFKQLQSIRSTLNNTTDNKSWSHGGKGSGYSSLKEPYNIFHDPNTHFEDKYRAFSYGYVRPKGKEDSYKNRLNTAKQVYNRLMTDDIVNATMESVHQSLDPIINEHDKGGFLQPKDAWDALSMREKSEMMKVAVNNGIYDLQTIRGKYNEFAKGGKMEEEELPPIVPFEQKTEVIITPDSAYNQYLNTLPDNQRFTPNDAYDSYFYWKLNGKPKNFEEAYNKGMFHYDHFDNSYHANSVAFGDDNFGYFMKPKTHDTVGYELDWFNKGLVTEEGGYQRPMTPEEKTEWIDFRNKYTLTDDHARPNYYMYKPKNKHSIGGPLVDTMSNEYASGGKIHIKPENRGKFTALKKRTGHSATWFKQHGTPAQKKMATFALNAKHWKH